MKICSYEMLQKASKQRPNAANSLTEKGSVGQADSKLTVGSARKFTRLRSDKNSEG